MSQDNYPMTPAIRYLKQHKLPFISHYYEQEEQGSAEFTARRLGLDPYLVVKTIVFMDENRKGVMVLMHGNKQIDTKTLAKTLGRKKFIPAPYDMAHRWTGYEFGGTSPFGTRQTLPIYVESSILDLPDLYINAGKRGFIIQITPTVLEHLGAISLQVAK